ADVFSNSWGIPRDIRVSNAMKGCFRRLVTEGRDHRGCVVLFSAGNENLNIRTRRCFAAAPGTLSVGACMYVSSPDRVESRDPDRFGNHSIAVRADLRAPYSNYGQDLDLTAPSHTAYDRANVKVHPLLSTVPVGWGDLPRPHGDYARNFGGTSAATPMVAGAAALLLSYKPELTWLDVHEILQASAAKSGIHPQGQVHHPAPTARRE